MNMKSILAVTLTALSLVPVACTITTTEKDATGGSSAIGGSADAAGSKSTGGTTASSSGGKTGVGGAANAAGASSIAGSANVAGSIGVAGSESVAGATGFAGFAGGGGVAAVAGNAGTTSAAGAAGAPASSCAALPTRVDVTDDVDAATTWTAGNLYVIPAGTTVYINATLTIEPCTVIKLGANARLYVATTGQLNAIGSAASHIVFTSLKDDSAGGDTNGDSSASQPSVSDWSTLIATANSSGFDYVEFRYADAGLKLSGASQSVKNSTFTYNKLALDAADVTSPATTVITSNVFYANTSPIVIDGGTAIDATNQFHNPAAPVQVNTFQAVDVITNIDNAVTWSNTEVAYALTDDAATYNVNSPAVLTLAAGVVVKVAAGSNLTVHTGATLSVAATATFTSYKDDIKLGDSNGDGAATTPADGDWSGVRIITSTSDTWLPASANLLYGTTH